MIFRNLLDALVYKTQMYNFVLNNMQNILKTYCINN